MRMNFFVPSARVISTPPPDAERIPVLGDLVVLRHVGIEVVLPVEGRVPVDLAAEHHAGHDGELHRFPVHDRQGSRIPEAHGTHVRVRFATRLQEAAAEHLRLRLQLDMRLQPDGILKFHESYYIIFRNLTALHSHSR